MLLLLKPSKILNKKLSFCKILDLLSNLTQISGRGGGLEGKTNFSFLFGIRGEDDNVHVKLEFCHVGNLVMAVI